MKKMVVLLLGSLVLSGLLACAGMAERKPKDEIAAVTEEPKSPIPSPDAEAKGGDLGDGDIGNGEVGNGDIGNGDFGNGDAADYAEAIEESVAAAPAAGSRGAKSKTEGTEWVSSEPRTARGGTPSVSGLKAGFADDNKQYNYFIQFLRQYGPSVHYLPIPVEERIRLKTLDNRKKPLASAAVSIYGEGGSQLVRGLTYADGSFLFFPAEHGADRGYRAVVTYNQSSREIRFERDGPREVTVELPLGRPESRSVPLDILFILDTTGSMGEEIERLKTTIEIINLNLASLPSAPRVRFGLVLYRDRGDEYVTEVVPFTEDLERFQAALNRVEADGGGDDPEDLQAALEAALGMSWNRGGIRLAFIVTDAPPHLDYSQRYTYVNAVRDARTGGIKIFSVGTGGLELDGELILRQISQYTAAKYIFLTYGEEGESEGGKPGSVSHHTGANYQTDKLEAIIIRFAREELAFASDQPLEGEEEYFQATAVTDEAKAVTLDKLFGQAVSQLIDYSSFRIPPETPASVLSLVPAAQELGAAAEYFSEQLAFSFSRGEAARKSFRVLERRDLQAILAELELQLSGLADDTAAARVGKLLGAQVLVTGRLFSKPSAYELFLKLLRVDGGEILSVTKLVIDRKLGVDGP